MTCDCDDRPPDAVPAPGANPAGAAALRARVGDHGSLFAALIARLSAREYPRLADLRTRELSDPAIALLDAWATAGDVLTFYTERMANEGYLRTATEYRSLVELARLVGYTPGPGVAASTYLAFTLERDPKQASAETVIPRGTAARSVPGDKEQPQTFETSDPLVARAEWNALRPRPTKPQDLRVAGQVDSIVVAGTATRLGPNDLILFVYGGDVLPVARYVLRVEVPAAGDATVVYLVPTDLSAAQFVADAHGVLDEFINQLRPQAALFQFVQALIDQGNGLRARLVPEEGLVELDAALNQVTTADGDWGKWKTALEAAGPAKLDAAAGVLDPAKWLADARSAIVPALDRYAADLTRIEPIVKALKAAWTPTPLAVQADYPGIAGMDSAAMKDRVKEAIAAINTEVGTWAGNDTLKATAQQLAQDLGDLLTAATDQPEKRDQFRRAFLRAWAKFTDSGLIATLKAPALHPPVTTGAEAFAKDSAADLKARLTAGSPDLAPVLGAIVGASLPVTDEHGSRWLTVLAGIDPDHPQTPHPAQVTITFSYIDKLPSLPLKSFDVKIEDVDVTGLWQRLALQPDTSLESMPGVMRKALDLLGTRLGQAAALQLDKFEPTPKFDALKADVNALGSKVLAINPTDPAPDPGTVAEVFLTAQALSQGANDVAQRLGDLKAKATTRVLDTYRGQFRTRVDIIVAEFGDPDGAGGWAPGVPNAHNMKELLAQFQAFVKTAPTLTAMVKDDGTNATLTKVLADLGNKPAYAADPGSPFAFRRAAAVGALNALNDQVGPFGVVGPAAPQGNDAVPDAAGLAQAVKALQGMPGLPAPLADRDLSQLLARSGPGDIPDLFRQIAGGLSPQLRSDLVAVWRQVRAPQVAPKVFAYKTVVPLFGYNAPRKSQIPLPPKPDDKQGPVVKSVERTWDELDESKFPGWRVGADVYLSQPVEGLTPGSTIVFRTRDVDRPCTVQRVLSPVQPGVWDVSTPGSYVRLAEQQYWHGDSIKPTDEITQLRQTLALLPSAELKLVEVPIGDWVGQQKPNPTKPVNPSSTDPDPATEIELDGLFPDLAANRLVVVQGERANLEGATAQELARIQYVRHILQNLAGDTVHTHLVLSAPLQHSYRRDKTTVFANVVAATQGETVREVLGSGDASVPFQRFALAKGPLTYVPAPTPAGAQSTLTVRVNDLLWQEAGSLLDAGPADRAYVVRADERGRSRVQFGDGLAGARLPTGRENVRAEYRVGLGAAGNVKAGAVSQLAHRPLGVKDVTNPLPAAGGADPEGPDQIRGHAPLGVLALDRLVAVRDYADFARTFAGIDKARARALPFAGRPTVHVTVAGAADAPVPPDSALLTNLRAALADYGDPAQAVVVQPRELLLLFISANVKVKPDARWAAVEPNVRAALLAAFGFARRELAQPVYLSEVMTVVQAVPGVEYVDVDVFGGVAESRFQAALQGKPPPGQSSPETAATVFADLLNQSKNPAAVPDSVVPAQDARLENGKLQPAQIAYLSPAVPDSLFLKEVPS